MKTLETKRLILRDWTIDDLVDFYEYAKVDGVGELAGWLHHASKDISLQVLNGFIEGGEVYALELKENHKVIGSLGIHHKSMDYDYPGDVHYEIGYVLSKEYWGKGLMSEAVKKAIVYAFEEMKVDVLWCGHFDYNDRSRRVVEKSGFKYYRDSVYDAKQLNRVIANKCYVMTKEDYENNKSSQ